MRKISVIHPSRSRSSIANKVRTEWLNKADGDIEYVFSLDNDDIQNTKYDGECIYNNNRSAIDAINKGAEYVKGDIFVVVSDDFSCPEHWDTLLLKALEGKEDFCVKTKDNIQPVLMTLPILDRVYYNRFGYIYHPSYIHMSSDVEMTAVAMMLGKAVNVDITFEHKHYSTGKFVKDAISIKNDKTYAQGHQNLKERLRTNFGIANPLIRYSDIKWHPK